MRHHSLTRQKFWIKALRETNLGVAQAFSTRLQATLKVTLIAKNFTDTRRREYEHPAPFNCESPLRAR